MTCHFALFIVKYRGNMGRAIHVATQLSYALIAQSVEQWPFKPVVEGSSPSGRTKVSFL